MWVIKLTDGSYYIGMSHKHNFFEITFELDRRVKTYATKAACEKDIARLHERFVHFDGYPVEVLGV